MSGFGEKQVGRPDGRSSRRKRGRPDGGPQDDLRGRPLAQSRADMMTNPPFPGLGFLESLEDSTNNEGGRTKTSRTNNSQLAERIVTMPILTSSVKEGTTTTTGTVMLESSTLKTTRAQTQMEASKSETISGTTAIESINVETVEAVTTAVSPQTGAKKKRKKNTEWILRNTGSILHTITSDSILPAICNVTWDQDPEYLCSYNWEESTNDTNVIFVPGEPPKWTPPTLPYTLELDSGYHYVDHNHARQPRWTYSPMFHALDVMNPDVQFTNVDVVADRNNLRTLLEFVQGKNVGPFRLDLYLNDNTLMLVRREAKFWMRVGAEGRSYGYNFENHFTRAGDGLENATSHYRIIRYPIGPLNVVVRVEVDAYYEDPNEDELPGPCEATPGTVPKSGGPEEKPKFSFKAPIQVIHKGSTIPNSKMAELKTQIKHPEKGYSLTKYLDQLWFGRTPHCLTGLYRQGADSIHQVNYDHTREALAEWESKVQESLQKLAALLGQLRDIVKAQRGPVRALVLVREEKDGPLRIREMEDTVRAVHTDFFFKYWRNGRRSGAPRPKGNHRNGPSHQQHPQGHRNTAAHHSHNRPNHQNTAGLRNPPGNQRAPRQQNTSGHQHRPPPLQSHGYQNTPGYHGMASNQTLPGNQHPPSHGFIPNHQNQPGYQSSGHQNTFGYRNSGPRPRQEQ